MSQYLHRHVDWNPKRREQQLQGSEQQFQGGQLRELHEAWTTKKKAPE
jgi:hypothetical protein